jgi:hypothetical protein
VFCLGYGHARRVPVVVLCNIKLGETVFRLLICCSVGVGVVVRTWQDLLV